jgi:N4-gp56 family major capsid protein
MAGQSFAGTTQRVGILKGEILAHADPKEVLGITGVQKKMPKNVGETVKFRRWLPYGGTDNKWITGATAATYAAAHLTAEGVTPSADSLTPTDVEATLLQYSCLYSLTDKMAHLHEDGAEIPAEMKKQTGERIGMVREMVRYGVLKAMTNIFYAGGTTRGTVASSLTVNLIRKVTKTLKANHAEMCTSILDSSPKFGVSSVEASYLVFCHTDMEPAIRDLPGFVHVANYGQRQVIHPQEIGTVESFRFILSPELAPVPDIGAAIGTTGLYSTTGTLIDVYPVIVTGEDAWGQVALRGSSALDASYIPVGTKSAADPLGQRGFIGATTWFSALMLNQGWAASIECGTPSLA